LPEINDAGLIANGFDQRAEAQVADVAQQAFAAAHDEGQGFKREGVAAQSSAVEPI
jgi:hypothetical protein